MDIDDKLQLLFRLQPLNEKVINMRNAVPEIYRKYVKQLCTNEMKTLVNVEINIVHTQLKMPDPRKVAPLNKPNKAAQIDVDALLEEQQNTFTALELLKPA